MADKKHEDQDKDKTPGAPDLPAEFKKPQSFSDSEQDDSSEIGHADASQSGPAEPQDEGSVKQVIESDQTDEAVEDIVRKEGDDLLETQDKNSAAAIQTALKTKKSWWKRGKFWWTIVFLLLVAATVLMAVPTTRYKILNFLGVRVSASVVVVDRTTSQPLKNVDVSINGVKASTDSKGEAKLEQLKQGPQKLKIERIAFATIEQDVTLGWGSNPLGTFKLKPSGAQYTFNIRDFLSNQPIEDAEVTSGKAVASADKDGKAVLTIDQTGESEVAVSVGADGYRTDEISLSLNTTDDVDVTLVPSSKAVFAASEDGRFNVYSMYIDGQDRNVLLEGSGNESSDMALSVSADGSRAALVSTREDIKAEDGSLLQSLTLINTGDGNNKVLDRGSDVMLIDWIGSTLIYQMSVPGETQGSDKRQRLVGYDYKEDKRVELASVNEFKSVASAQGAVYYSAGEGLKSVNPGGGNKQTVLGPDVLHAYRTDYGTLTVQADDGWHSFNLSDSSSGKISAPASVVNRIYVSDAAGDRSLWVDGSTLKSYNLSSAEDSDVVTQSGLSYPARWLTNTAALYRAGGADYAISAQGGEAHKVADVTRTSGVVQTY